MTEQKKEKEEKKKENCRGRDRQTDGQHRRLYEEVLADLKKTQVEKEIAWMLTNVQFEKYFGKLTML